VATALGRTFVGIELSAEYASIARRRIGGAKA
jgi:DNA modification methylase